MGNCQVTQSRRSWPRVPIQRGHRTTYQVAYEGGGGGRQASAQDTTLLCRHWARCLCLRTRGISGGKGDERQAARAARSSLKAPCATRWTLAGPTLPQNRKDL